MLPAPAPFIIIFGIELDMTSSLASLLAIKLDSLCHLVGAMKNRMKTTLHDFQVLLGDLKIACKVVLGILKQTHSLLCQRSGLFNIA